MGSLGGTRMKRILIVDDESLIGYSLSASLRRDDTYVKAKQFVYRILGQETSYHQAGDCSTIRTDSEIFENRPMIDKRQTARQVILPTTCAVVA